MPWASRRTTGPQPASAVIVRSARLHSESSRWFIAATIGGVRTLGLADEHLFPCAHRQTSDCTMTLVGTDGSHVSQYWTVVDFNWGQGGGEDE